MFSPLGMDPVFEFPGDVPFKAADALLIDPDSLRQDTTWESLPEQSKTITTLTLRSLPEVITDAYLNLFIQVQHLTLDRITLLNRIFKGVPANLQTLKILDCRIGEEVITTFCKASLVSVQFLRSYHLVPFHNAKNHFAI